MTYRIVLIVLSMILISCKNDDSSTNPTTQNNSYIPFNEGDSRQIVFVEDSSTSLLQVIKSIKRNDGVDMLPMVWTNGMLPPDTFYYFIRDGYFIASNLKPSNDSINPYYEQKLGKINPVNGESWKHIHGNPDTTNMTAHYFEERYTFIGSFKNVFGFILTNKNRLFIDTIMTPCYAQGIGYIGTDLDSDLKLDVSISYLKVGAVEMGNMFPAKNSKHQLLHSKDRVNQIIAYSVYGSRNRISK